MIRQLKQDFREKARNANIPLEVTFELTYRCNLSCVHCYLKGETCEEMTTGEIFAVIDQLAECGTLHLIFTGGECLLREDFFDIAGYARSKNLALSLITNATLIDGPTAKKFKDLNFLEVSVSIYGLNCHDRITSTKGSFIKSHEAIKHLIRENVSVQVKTPVMNLNFNEIEQLSVFCEQLGLDFAPNPFITMCSDGTRKTLALRMDDGQLSRYTCERIESGERASGFNSFCNTGRSVAAISPSGDVFPCIAFKKSIGSLKKQSFSDIWNNSPYLSFLRSLELAHMKECSVCTVRNVCRLCPAEALEEDGDILSPHKEACRIAYMRHKLINERKCKC